MSTRHKNGRKVCPYYDQSAGSPQGKFTCKIPDNVDIPDCGPNCEIPEWYYEATEEISVLLDGNAWTAHRVVGWTDMMERPCGFGDTPEEAVTSLLQEEGKAESEVPHG